MAEVAELGPLVSFREGFSDLEGVNTCIRCGLCLTSCPTYRELGTEMAAPRGRIQLMKAVAEGRIQPTSERFREYMYVCLGCRACETACPSGVRYGELVEAARAHVEQANRRPWGERMLRNFAFRGLLPHPRRLALAFLGLRLFQHLGLQDLTVNLAEAGVLPERLGMAQQLLPLPNGLYVGRLPERTPAMGRTRLCVAFLEGCVMNQMYASTNRATLQVLSRNGCEVLVPRDQTCCGALHIHSGELTQGEKLARRNIDAFLKLGVDAVVTNSAGCGAAMKEYGHLLRDDPAYAGKAVAFSKMVRDVSELLVDQPFEPPRASLPWRVTYHDACHLAHAQGVRAQPRALLCSIPALELVELAEADWCCGSAGIYNITNPQMAQRLLERKLDNIEATGAQVVAIGNPGCLMQIAAGLRMRKSPMRALHPIDILAEAYHGDGA